MKRFTEQEALKITILFLEQYNERTKPDDTGIIAKELSDAQTHKIYSELFDEWKECITKIKGGSADLNNRLKRNFTEKEVFEAMILFLEKYHKRTNSDDIGGFLSDLLHVSYGATADPAAWYDWQKCLQKIK